uniref:Uncharacterized protein n=1 Tax=Tanacetum cinerariifolium TaxID=118510 RepID=A0A699ITD3_TANCI|nr:hypothetical protein [Tanacetum cinerariifolium]
MTLKLDDMIEFPKSQTKRTYNEDLECEIVMVKMPKCMTWFDDEPISDLDMMVDKVDNPSPQSTPQFLPSAKNVEMTSQSKRDAVTMTLVMGSGFS